ncbi:MAG: type II toxin-antitoxin system ParD family antitoxin [Phycisphaerales bacterium]
MASSHPLNLTLTPDLRRFVSRQVAAGGFGTPGEFLRHLLRKELAASTVEEIDARLIAAEASGPARRVSESDWAELRQRGNKRAAAARRSTKPPARRKSA